MRSPLYTIQDHYSSRDPRKRWFGTLGKGIIEAVSTLLVSAILIAPLYLIQALVGEAAPFPTALVRDLISGGLLLVVAQIFICDVIVEKEDSVQGTAGSATDEAIE